MWQTIEVEVGREQLRGRYRLEGRRLILEWRGGRSFAWCGQVKPELVAASCLRRLGSTPPMAA
ncbi:MAG: hypothetical protein U1C74_09780 [Phenylobacterium sp.]|nr:hypothetical protein [Phenylobacterium sp.]